MDDDLEIIRGTDNPYRDFGIRNPDLHAAKSAVSRMIGRIMQERALSTEAAAEAAGATPDEIAALLHPRLSGFTLERLFEIAHRLSPQTEITIGFRPAAPAMQLDDEAPPAAAAE